jgi:hypothetical protein
MDMQLRNFIAYKFLAQFLYRPYRKFRNKKPRRSIFEPMLEYSHSTIASGASPIGSAERAPDRMCIIKEEQVSLLFTS